MTLSPTYRRLLAGTAIFALGAVALAPSLKAEDTATTRTFDVTGVSKVDVSGLEAVTITLGDTPSLVITEEKNRFSDVEVSVKGNTLKIDGDDGGWFSDRDYSAQIVLTSLEAFSAAGATEVELTDIIAQDFELELAGASEVTMSGSCTTLDIDSAGASEVNAKNFVCADVKLDLAGASDLIVHATQSLDIDTAGVCDVIYYGAPEKVTKDVAGFCDISPAKP